MQDQIGSNCFKQLGGPFSLCVIYYIPVCTYQAIHLAMLPRARLSRTFVRVLHRKLLSTKDTPAKQTLSHSPSAASSSGQRVSPLEPKTNKGARENRNPLQALGMTLDGPMPVQRSVIDALGPTSFTISGVRVSGSVLIMPDYSTVWNIDDMSQLVPDAFALIKLALPRPDLVLIGTGASTLVC